MGCVRALTIRIAVKILENNFEKQGFKIHSHIWCLHFSWFTCIEMYSLRNSSGLIYTIQYQSSECQWLRHTPKQSQMLQFNEFGNIANWMFKRPKILAHSNGIQTEFKSFFVEMHMKCNNHRTCKQNYVNRFEVKFVIKFNVLSFQCKIRVLQKILKINSHWSTINTKIATLTFYLRRICFRNQFEPYDFFSLKFLCNVLGVEFSRLIRNVTLENDSNNLDNNRWQAYALRNIWYPHYARIRFEYVHFIDFFAYKHEWQCILYFSQ